MEKVDRSKITIKRVQYLNAGYTATHIEEKDGDTFFYTTDKLGLRRLHSFKANGDVLIEEVSEGVTEVVPVVVDAPTKPVKKTRTKKDTK